MSVAYMIGDSCDRRITLSENLSEEIALSRFSISLIKI